MMSKPRGAVLFGAALMGLTLGIPAASADPARANSRAYQAWRSANALKVSRALPGSTAASPKSAPDAGGQTVTTGENDTFH